MHGQDSRDCLELHEDDIIDEQVGFESKLEAYSLIDDRQRKLDQDAKPASAQLVRETRLVRTFQKSGTQRGVNLHRCVNDLAAANIDLIDVHRLRGSLMFMVFDVR